MTKKEYIERDKAIEALEEADSTFNISMGAFNFLSQLLSKIPTADVRPVVRGKWKLDSDPGEPWRYVCNICGEKTKDTVMGKPRANFCPNCGAMMEES